MAMNIHDITPVNDPHGVWPFIQAHFPVEAEMLLYTDEFWSDAIWRDTDHTISWHVACMRNSKNPISRYVARKLCVKLNLLTANHCDEAIAAEGACGSC